MSGKITLGLRAGVGVALVFAFAAYGVLPAGAE